MVSATKVRRRKVVHLVNAYTWAGRRGWCGLTSEWLPSVQNNDRGEVTCQECLTAAADAALGETR